MLQNKSKQTPLPSQMFELNDNSNTIDHCNSHRLFKIPLAFTMDFHWNSTSAFVDLMRHSKRWKERWLRSFAQKQSSPGQLLGT
jgi:hypothetical protein